MSETQQETILITLIGLREGVDPRRFLEFAVSQDLPAWRQQDVVVAFDTYRVREQDRAEIDADFVEVLRVRSLDEWIEIAQNDPAVAPLAGAFAELVDEDRTRRIQLGPSSNPPVDLLR